MVLIAEIQGEETRATIGSAQLKALTEKWVTVRPQLAPVRAKNGNARWNGCSVAKRVSSVQEDVSSVLKAVSGEVADATKRKFF